MIPRLLSLPVLAAAWIVTSVAAIAAQPDIPPSADEVFHLSVQAVGKDRLDLAWSIAPGTYLYRDRISVSFAGQPVSLSLATGITEDDPVFGPTQIYRDRIDTRIDLPPSASGTLTVSYQGCAEHRLCYPPVVKSVDVKTLAIDDAGN